jgi:iron complex transport system ATP-binding protein
VELKIQGLSKSYGAQDALQDVTLDLQPGTVALLGPNGSGKTTLLRCLASLFPFGSNTPPLAAEERVRGLPRG